MSKHECEGTDAGHAMSLVIALAEQFDDVQALIAKLGDAMDGCTVSIVAGALAAIAAELIAGVECEPGRKAIARLFDIALNKVSPQTAAAAAAAAEAGIDLEGTKWVT